MVRVLLCDCQLWLLSVLDIWRRIGEGITGQPSSPEEPRWLLSLLFPSKTMQGRPVRLWMETAFSLQPRKCRSAGQHIATAVITLHKSIIPIFVSDFFLHHLESHSKAWFTYGFQVIHCKQYYLYVVICG